MQLTMQKVKAWVQGEMRGAKQFLAFALQEMWWAAVLAAGMQLPGGRTGGVNGVCSDHVLLEGPEVSSGAVADFEV